MVKGLDTFKEHFTGYENQYVLIVGADILRISVEFLLEHVDNLPETVHMDIKNFLMTLKREPFDTMLLKSYALSNEEIVARLQDVFNV